MSSTSYPPPVGCGDASVQVPSDDEPHLLSLTSKRQQQQPLLKFDEHQRRLARNPIVIASLLLLTAMVGLPTASFFAPIAHKENTEYHWSSTLYPYKWETSVKGTDWVFDGYGCGVLNFLTLNIALLTAGTALCNLVALALGLFAVHQFRTVSRNTSLWFVREIAGIVCFSVCLSTAVWAMMFIVYSKEMCRDASLQTYGFTLQSSFWMMVSASVIGFVNAILFFYVVVTMKQQNYSCSYAV